MPSWLDPLEGSDIFFRQLIVGRYRNWGSFNVDHFIVFLSIIGGAVYIYILLLNAIAKRYAAAMEKIPMSKLPLDEDSLSEAMYLAVSRENNRVQEYARHRRIEPERLPSHGMSG